MHFAGGPEQNGDLLDALLEQLEALANLHPAATFEELVAFDPALSSQLAEDSELAAQLAAQFSALCQIDRLISPSPEASPALPVIPGYVALENVGYGGAGVVFRARQTSLGREVALKLMLGGRFAGERARDRFRREAELAARLQHPNIAQIYDHGEFERLPYLAQEFVRGGTLADKLHRQRLTPTAASQLVETLARAVEYAHHSGIVHRDLKPSNVLLTEAGEPKIIDFGLAKAVDFDSQLTRTGESPGTPSYMAPEQVDGTPIGPHTDVYGLGAILYEVLAGRPPFEGATTGEVFAKVLSVPARFDALAAKETPLELRAIALKCLEKNPLLRYRSARALAGELRRWQEGYPILARPLGRVARARRWARRRPAMAALILVSIAATLAMLAGSIVYSVRITGALQLAERHRQAAERRQIEVERQQQLLRERLYTADVPLAQTAVQRRNVAQARKLLERHEPPPDGEDVRDFSWYLLDRMCHSERLCLRGHGGDVYTALFSPSGRILATCSQDGTVRLWDHDNGRQLAVLTGHTGELACLAFSRDGQRLASGDDDGVVRIWDVEACLKSGSSAIGGSISASYQELKVEAGIWSLAFSPSDRLLAIGMEKKLRILDLAANEVVREWGGLSRDARSITFLQGDSQVAYSDYLSLYIGDVASGELKPFAAQHEHSITCLAVAPGRNLFASADTVGVVRLWNCETLEPVACSIPQIERIDGLDFSPDESLLAIAGRDRAIELWDVEKQELQLELLGHTAAIWSVEFSPDGSEIIAASADGTSRIWSTQPDSPRQMTSTPSTSYTSAAFAPDSNLLAAGTNDGAVEFWDWTTGRQLRQQTLRVNSPQQPDGAQTASPIQEISFVANGELATIDPAGTVEFWNLQTRERQARNCILSSGNGLLSSSDGRLLVAWADNDLVRVWNAHDRQWSPAAWPLGRVYAAALTADHRRLAVLEHNSCQFRLLRLDDGVVENSWRLAPVYAGCMAISADGSWIATGGADVDRGVHIWDVQTGRECAGLVGHSAAVMALAIHPDRRTLASASTDGTVRIWNLFSQHELLVLRSKIELPSQLMFSPDGRGLALLGKNAQGQGLLRVWAVPQSGTRDPKQADSAVRAELAGALIPPNVSNACKRESAAEAQYAAVDFYCWAFERFDSRFRRPAPGVPLLVTFEERMASEELQIACVEFPDLVCNCLTISPWPLHPDLPTIARTFSSPRRASFCYALHYSEHHIFCAYPPRDGIECRLVAAREIGASDEYCERYRNVHRWAKAHGFVGGWPTFDDHPIDGQPGYGIALIKPGAGKEVWVPMGGPAPSPQ